MKQITVVAKGHPDLVAEITEALAARKINIETLEAEEVRGMGVVVFSVDRYDDALQALRDASFHAVTEDALVVQIADEPGALARVARRLADAGIHIRSARIIRRTDGSVVAISTDRIQEARDVLKDLLIH